MSRALFCRACMLFVLSTLSAALADEKSDEAARQKVTAKENLDKIGAKTPTFIETTDLIVCGTISPKEAKPIADLLQKQYAIASKALKFDDKDKAIRGKFVVYCFSSKREYASFARQIRQERPESTETNTFDVSGDDCFLAVVVAPSGNFPIDPEVSASIGAALLERKVGGKFLPPWASIGFRKAITMRSIPKIGDDTRKEVRSLLTKGKIPMWLNEALEEDSPEKLLIAASVMDFLTFSTPPKLIDFVTGFKPSDEVPNPTLEQAKTLAGFKNDEFDKAWRNWVLKGK